MVSDLLSAVCGERLEALFLRERRPNPGIALLAKADGHTAALQQTVPQSETIDLDVFESDGAVAIGRRAVEALASRDLSRFTDLVVDLSALSIGCSFPVVKLLFQRLANQLGGERPSNLHAMVTSSPSTDDCIVAHPSDKVGPVHGFRGRWSLDETAAAARLWIPQLRFRRSGALERLYKYIGPHEIVPALPFPAVDPRLGDRLVEHYITEFAGSWSVDSRSIVYANERSPLDFYRTVLRIHDARHRVFEQMGGNLLVLSPIGSKVLALGAMMAAMERDFPVVYVEALSFDLNLDELPPSSYTGDELVHVWLYGEADPAVDG